MDRDVTLKIDVEVFYQIINALRDSCGCDVCRNNADLLIQLRRNQ